MTDDNTLRDLPPKKVKPEIDKLLAMELPHEELRERLEALATARAFDGFTWLWGPELYRRNKVTFRPFILNHFSTWQFNPTKTLLSPFGSGEAVAWKGDVAARMDAWFAEADAADDVELFRRLYQWKHSERRWNRSNKEWIEELTRRFLAADSSSARHTALAKFDVWGQLDEDSALKLYSADPVAAGPFILKHLEQTFYSDKRELWTSVYDEARRRGDDDFAFKLYRKQIPLKQWSADVERLAKAIASPEELCSELERRHPEGWSLDLGKQFYQLVQQRGREVLPYILKHLRTVYRSWWGARDGYASLVKLASQKEWWDLWGALVRTCSKPDEYNAELTGLLKNRSMPDDEITHRLLLLTGVSREWNFGPFGFAQVQQLTDDAAVLLYDRFPDLLRGPFKINISTGYGQALPKLTDAVLAANDETLIDYLASRMVTRPLPAWSAWSADLLGVTEKFSAHYERFRDDDVEFSRRAANVLGQVPAYTIHNYNELIRTNHLARMFYERSASKYLAHPIGLRDLLESPEIHAQALAFRVLGLANDEARRLARENLDLLQATLLRPLHRATRALAFRALSNAATDLESARRLHARCRDALRLPDKRYPKESLVGLIAALLHRWPELRSPREQPLIYGAIA